MNQRLDIAICGCGSAGLAAALFLHRAGHRVHIFERFATPSAVGSGLLLQPTGLAVLKELGLIKPILELGAPIDRLFGRAVPSNRIALDVRYSKLGEGWRALGIHRAALFETLFSAIREQIPVTPNTQVQSVDYESEKAILVARGGTNVGAFDLIVDALGANSPLAPPCKRKVLQYGALWVNVPWSASSSFKMNWLEQRYSLAKQMIGVLPIGKQSSLAPLQAALFWSLKRSDLVAWQTRGIDRWRTDIQKLWPEATALTGHIEHVNRVTFAQYDHFTAATPHSRQIAHIGDAAHATSPQLGQGANMALLDAFALGLAIENNSSVVDALEHYARMRRWHVRVFQWASEVFTPFYQSDSRVLPFVRDWITAPLSRMPIGDRVVARLVSGMTTPPLAGKAFAPLRLGRANARLSNDHHDAAD